MNNLNWVDNDLKVACAHGAFSSLFSLNDWKKKTAATSSTCQTQNKIQSWRVIPTLKVGYFVFAGGWVTCVTLNFDWLLPKLPFALIGSCVNFLLRQPIQERKRVKQVTNPKRKGKA